MLAAVAGCGQDDPGRSSAAPTSNSVETSSVTRSGVPSLGPSGLPPQATAVPVPPQGATPLPKEQVDTGGLPPYYEKKDVVIAPDGMSITVWGMARDSCSSVQGTVEETAQEVRIVLSPMATPQGGSPDKVCTQVLTPVPVTVQLKAPVGNRKVIVTEKQTY